MKSSKKHLDKIEEALIAAYRRQAEVSNSLRTGGNR